MRKNICKYCHKVKQEHIDSKCGFHFRNPDFCDLCEKEIPERKSRFPICSLLKRLVKTFCCIQHRKEFIDGNYDAFKDHLIRHGYAGFYTYEKVSDYRPLYLQGIKHE